MDTEKKIVLTDGKGKKTNYHILCSFDSKQTHRNYIIYTDFTKSSDNKMNVHYGYYELKNHCQLKPVETKEEINLMDSILSSLEKEANCLFCLLKNNNI